MLTSRGGGGANSGAIPQDGRRGAALGPTAERTHELGGSAAADALVGGEEIGDAALDGLLDDNVVGAAGLAGLQLQDAEVGHQDQGEADPEEPAEAAGHKPLAERSSAGVFTGVLRNRRKMQAATFPIIEQALLEAANCGQLPHCAAVPKCAAHGGAQCQRWRIRGPVLGRSDDAVGLTTNVTVCAAPWMSLAEVCVRAMPHLVPSVYARSTMAYNSVRLVASKRLENTAPTCAGAMACSFRGLSVGAKLSDKDVKEILERSFSPVVAAKGKLPRGCVSVTERGDARYDPVLKSAVRAMLRKRCIRAATDYRDKGAALMRGRPAGSTGLRGAGSVGRVRRHLKLQDSSVPGSRATRLRFTWGLSQMRLLPSRKQLQTLRREAVDTPGRVAHYLLTDSAQGGVLRWDYVIGSVSAGVRRYQTSCGIERRLRAHTNKYWDKRRSTRDKENFSENEDDDVYYDSPDVELNGCDAPLEKDLVAIEQLIARSQSFLENDDGTGEIMVLGVGFDVVGALQKTMDTQAVPGLTADDVRSATRAALTFAVDGGEMRRRSIIAYTVSVSTPCLRTEGTDLLPILYHFMGEKRVSRALTK